MEVQDFDRRALLKGGGAAFAGLTVLRVAGPAHAFPGGSGPEEVLPWLDQPPTSPDQLVWEELDSWLTPADDFFIVNHYNQPRLSAADWRLAIEGLVRRKQSLSLDDLKRRPRREVDFTLECSGNTGLPFFHGGVGNARWAGAQLAPILRQAGVLDEGIEVVFWGADGGEQIIRDNVGVLDPDGDSDGDPTNNDNGPAGPHHTGR